MKLIVLAIIAQIVSIIFKDIVQIDKLLVFGKKTKKNKPPRVGKIGNGYAVLLLDGEEYERLLGACAILRHECEIDGDCQRSILKYILKCIFRKNGELSHYIGRDLQYRGIKQAILYMEMHFREKITLQTLAREAGYHPTYFSELFKKVTGETYVDTLNRLRIGNARTLLSSGFSVSDACYMSGFGSLSNFLTVFKKNCKMSPMEYKTSSHKS